MHLPTRFVLLAAMMVLPAFLSAQEITPISARVPSSSDPARPVRLPGTALAASPTATPQQTLQPQPLGTPFGTPVPQPARSLPAMRENEMIPNIDFPNTDIRQVLEFYEKLTGKKALYDTTVQGNVQVRVLKPVTRLEAIRILETVFALNGFVLIPGPGDIVKVIYQNKNVRQFSIPILSEPEQLPESNQVVSYLFKLENADPAEVKTALDQIIAPTPNVTNVVALPKSQAVLVTENSDIIRNLIQIVAKLDARPAEVVSEFFTLQRADAKEVVEKLTKMFEKTPGSTGTPAGGAGRPGGAAPENGGAPGGPVTLSEDSLIVGKIKIEADTRTNRIHVITRPANLPFLRTLIAELDSGQPLGIPSTRPLRFVLASDVLDIVAGSVAEPGVKVEKLETKEATTGAANPVSNTGSNLGGYDSTRGTSSRRSSRSSSSGVNPGPLGAGRENAQADIAPEGRIIRNTKIIADNRINAIIVVGTDEMKRKVFKLLDQIDVRSPQVLLTAVIGELTLDANEEFGIDYLLHSGSLTGGTASIAALGLTSSVPGLARNAGASLKNILSATSTSGGVTALVGVTNSFDIIINALESTGRFRVTSRPMVFTSNNRRAVISSGESVPVPGEINSSLGYGLGNTQVIQSNIDYIPVELKLSVLPLINSEREVTLQITQTADAISGYTTISGISAPNVTTRSIDTTVSVANEATVILGGLVSEQKQNTKSGIPVLHRIPIIGPLFGSTKKNMKRTELIVIIRPTVTQGPVEAIKATEKALEKTNFPPDLDATLDPPAARGEPAGPLKCFAPPNTQLRPEDN